MIRRGLQLVVGVGIFMMLGAAPLLAQYSPPGNFPAAVTLSGVPSITHGQTVPLDVNGYYVAVSTSNNASTTFVRYNEDGQNGFLMRIERTPGGNPIWAVRLVNAAENAVPVQATFNSASYPSTPFTSAVNTHFTGGVAGTATIVLHSAFLSEYELTFPDWSKAATIIPLGFGLAMAFWAAAVALSVSMKWMRDLASAAS